MPVIIKISKISNGTPNTRKSHQSISNEVNILKTTSLKENKITPVQTNNSGKKFKLSFIKIYLY